MEKLKELDYSYEEYYERFNNLLYLATMTETTLFEAYNAALLFDSEKPFAPEIPQEVRDALYRLKFRAINQARSQDFQKHTKMT